MCILGICIGAAYAQSADYSAVLDFAGEYDVQDEVQALLDTALTGEGSLDGSLGDFLKERLKDAAGEILTMSSAMLGPVLLLALLNGVLPGSENAAVGAGFLLRMMLLLSFANLADASIAEASKCLASVKRFSDAVAPGVAALLSAMGMEGSAALVSPAAALAGDAAQALFMDYGMPLCRIALCTSIAGNLSEEISLSRFTSLFRKAVNWTAGLATTLFTALLALQGSVSEGLDGVAVRTAKFAVDSAAPVIGSGVSDAWESYISGLLVAKNALGVSGIAALLLACARPVLLCLTAMLVLSLTAAVLDMFGEKTASCAAGQIAGVCQMALSLCTGAMAIGTILLGAAMAAGRGLAA